MLLFLLVLVASTKSAQLPFSSWLPAAMAAPTPVSSLVHSSTLVTAGVYLLIRLNYLLSSASFLWILTRLGLLTIIIAGLRAVGELDMKKVIALSTLSQLGIIFITLGLGLPSLAFFHLISHAYFKAMLFMCAGAIIHSLKDYQDLRILGGRLTGLPYAARIFLVANLRLCGIPFISGFFSKDLILEVFIIRGPNLLIFFLAIIATGLTVIYSIKLSVNIFLGSSRSEPIFNLCEIRQRIKISILVLLVLSCAGGIGISWLLESTAYLIFLPSWIKIFILLIILLSSTLGNFKLSPKNYFMERFLHYI
ncbi:MAG: NADH dehydrogenase subunit 5 [Burkholderiales bacterium]|nr:NADH dehydrogenase subunit 5 [Burkholderiales bacterium]